MNFLGRMFGEEDETSIFAKRLRNMEENKIIIYQTEDGQTQSDVRLENETVWLTQAQMAELFEKTPQNITMHIGNAYKEGELERDSTCKEYLQVQREGKRSVSRKVKYYDLDVIISVGYRVHSKRGTASIGISSQDLQAERHLLWQFCRNQIAIFCFFCCNFVAVRVFVH